MFRNRRLLDDALGVRIVQEIIVLRSVAEAQFGILPVLLPAPLDRYRRVDVTARVATLEHVPHQAIWVKALGRLPDAGTWSGRVAQLRAGTRTLPWIGDSLAATAEFTGGVDLTTPAEAGGAKKIAR